MNEQHPITPPRELVQEWIAEIWHEGTPVQVAHSDLHIATRAAQWGADQELEGTLAEVSFLGGHVLVNRLRAARRPKPLSDKEQACRLLECYGTSGVKLTADQCTTILRALEALPND